METKPLVYLDHNVLDFLYKNPSAPLKQRLISEMQVLFSDENLAEIKRCGLEKENYAKILDELDAHYIKMTFGGSKFMDEATIMPYLASRCLAIREKVAPNFDTIHKKNFAVLHKILGGKKEIDLDSVYELQKSAHREIIELSTGETKDSSGTSLNVEIGHQVQEYAREVDIRKAETKAIIGDDVNFSAVDLLREKTLGPRVLNNIDGSGVIQRLWRRFQMSDASLQGISLDQFFGIDETHQLQGNPLPTYCKLYVMHLILNAAGFHSDSDLLEERGFLAAISDAIHAANGAFTNRFITMDRRLFKRAQAIYEYLHIDTQVELWNPQNN